ncbi:MAG: phenylacetic acid degradation protein [Rhodospirillaceae bacterium]|nr:phenylacetic acid degradation protein [Rhodospirillaceae bacterium]
MVEFHRLRVMDIYKTIRDATVVSLCPENDVNFDFVQGQYLTFRRVFKGTELRRSYSICSSKDEILQVGIKLVRGGVFSSWANSELEVGDFIESMAPMGNFYLKAAEGQAYYLAFAGGSGITPILSILKTGLAAEPEAHFTLVYVNRNINTVMFREELENLKNIYMERFRVIHILKDDSQNIDLFKGHIDAEKCDRLFECWIDVINVSMAFICGPEPMMQVVSKALEQHGLNRNKLRREFFTNTQLGRLKNRMKCPPNLETGTQGQVIIGGETRSLKVTADSTLLQAALDNNIDAPFACCSGVCSTCKAMILEGDVEMISNHSLEDYEVEAGFILTCQSYPVSDTIVWDYDKAGH